MRIAAFFFLCGLAWRLLLRLLPESSPLWLVAAADACALFPPVGVAIRAAARQGWLAGRPRGAALTPLLWAIPYPYRTVFGLYAERARFLPDSWNDAVSSPTGYYLWLSAFLLASLPLTSAMALRSLEKARDNVSEASGEEFRRLGYVLFALTGAAILLPDPLLGTAFLRWCPDLLSLGAFCFVYGRGLAGIGRKQGTELFASI